MLSRNEVIDVLTVVAVADGRTPGDPDVTFWSAALNGAGMTSAAECADAIAEHYSETDKWVMPYHVIRKVRAKRTARLRGINPEALVDDIDPDDPQREAIMRARVAQVASGNSTLKAITGGRA